MTILILSLYDGLSSGIREGCKGKTARVAMVFVVTQAMKVNGLVAPSIKA